jgi:hypothetical protein
MNEMHLSQTTFNTDEHTTIHVRMSALSAKLLIMKLIDQLQSGETPNFEITGKVSPQPILTALDKEQPK